MSVRTVKGTVFTIVIDDKRIVVKHVYGRGKRCRVTVPPGAQIEEQLPQAEARRVPSRMKINAETSTAGKWEQGSTGGETP